MKIAKSTILAVGLLGVLFVILFVDLEIRRGKFLKPDGMTVWVYNIGQGDAIFIDGPEKQILIDGGPDSTVLEKLSASMLPWDRSIDAVIVTHPHADHLMGLVPVLERYKVGNVFHSGQGYGTPEFFQFQKLAPQEQTLKAGDVIDLGKGATLTALWPDRPYNNEVIEDPNDGSVVLLLEYGETSMLLTGDAGVAEEERWNLPHVDVLKIGHHGSRTSTSEELLEMATPDTAIISVAAENEYGLPDEDVLQRLADHAVMIYRTDVHNDVRMWTDGGEPHIQSF
jgi:competence protein ComEC